MPDPRFLELKAALAERLDHAVAQIEAANLPSLLDPLMREVVRTGFGDAHADEGTLWLVDADGEHLVPAHNTGPQADLFVGSFKQPLNEGLICMVFSTEQAFMENEVFRNEQQSRRLDTMLQVQTHSLMAVPFNLFNRCCGVVSCVQLHHPEDTSPPPGGFQSSDLISIQRTTTLLSRLLEYRLLGSTVGLTSD